VSRAGAQLGTGEGTRLLTRAATFLRGHTDMRKSINGLSAIEEGNSKLGAFSGAMFVFRNRNRDQIKILEWDGDGFLLYFKRLEKGRLTPVYSTTRYCQLSETIIANRIVTEAEYLSKLRSLWKITAKARLLSVIPTRLNGIFTHKPSTEW
jgi:hypothetical protein